MKLDIVVLININETNNADLIGKQFDATQISK